MKEPVADSVYMFSYTSGTTGPPKAVKMTHKMVIAVMASCTSHGVEVGMKDTTISYLPLAHSMEQCFINSAFTVGLKYGFFSGDVLKLVDDVQALKPTIFPSVPRLFNKMYDKVMATINAAPQSKQNFFHKALNAKVANLEGQAVYKHTIYDALVFNKIKARLGGNVKLMVTGSAPISREVLNFLKCAFQVPVFEGYGQTETAGAIVATKPSDPTT